MRTYNNSVTHDQVLHDIKNIVERMAPACNKAKESVQHLSNHLNKKINWPESKQS